jgi:hypothetical protein
VRDEISVFLNGEDEYIVQDSALRVSAELSAAVPHTHGCAKEAAITSLERFDVFARQALEELLRVRPADLQDGLAAQSRRSARGGCLSD